MTIFGKLYLVKTPIAEVTFVGYKNLISKTKRASEKNFSGALFGYVSQFTQH